MRSYITDPDAPRGLRLDDSAPDPDPAPGEAVIAVEAFGINRGELALLTVRDRDWRPGQDVAGTVVTPAADGTGPGAGTRVVAIVDGGGWSERVACPTNRLAPIDDAVAAVDAAALPIAGLTALRALREGGSLLGERVLVTAATGAVGQFAIQLARAAGARVTALVSRPESADEARAAGAHVVVTDLGDGPGGYRLVCDGAGGDVLREALHHLAPHGVIATYGAMAGRTELGLADLLSVANPRIVGLVHSEPPELRGADLGVLADLVASGALRPRIGRDGDWSEVREVLDAMAGQQVRGKVVLRVS
ncbi:zinc-binding dehydrogenase [Actinomycetospora endophytica]|uniref:Zinc-binding dehydrogenase n=1 Tax=Actinomycetospora endophytica TaxID=2291215 RepID=A0ABS8P9A4_9PSEU|nr:zinc-binding dehydrogenase [Actinomycetospora endophytica]MCD2194850.1 zinc-binding dehydrogenase [Actinomycetospora endophytica]